MVFRKATTDDALQIAQLHAASWQIAYRGILSDEYLDNQVLNDRIAVWTERTQNPADNQVIFVFEEDGQIIAFTCAFANKSEEFGTYIDNLHVKPNLKGTGFGRKLMRAVAEWSIENYNQPKLYLHVFEENRAARGFYERVGGTNRGNFLENCPDGSQAMVCYYTWNEFTA
ncbi:MAG: GNAT family N-acetyltransferase [Spirosomataceae bacterium]